MSKLAKSLSTPAVVAILSLATLPQTAATDVPDADWPWWGGPRWDWKPATPDLADTWPESGPPVIWRRPLGEGYSAISVRDGNLYTMWRNGEEETVVAIKAADGRDAVAVHICGAHRGVPIRPRRRSARDAGGDSGSRVRYRLDREDARARSSDRRQAVGARPDRRAQRRRAPPRLLIEPNDPRRPGDRGGGRRGRHRGGVQTERRHRGVARRRRRLELLVADPHRARRRPTARRVRRDAHHRVRSRRWEGALEPPAPDQQRFQHLDAAVVRRRRHPVHVLGLRRRRTRHPAQQERRRHHRKELWFSNQVRDPLRHRGPPRRHRVRVERRLRAGADDRGRRQDRRGAVARPYLRQALAALRRRQAGPARRGRRAWRWSRRTAKG